MLVNEACSTVALKYKSSGKEGVEVVGSAVNVNTEGGVDEGGVEVSTSGGVVSADEGDDKEEVELLSELGSQM